MTSVADLEIVASGTSITRGSFFDLLKLGIQNNKINQGGTNFLLLFFFFLDEENILTAEEIKKYKIF